MSGSTAHVDLSGGLGNQLFALADLLASGRDLCACKRATPSPNPHSTTDYCATLLPDLPTQCTGASLHVVPVRHRYHKGVRDLGARLRIDRPPLDAAFLHIRGGDYIGHATHFIPLSAYYERALRHFAPDTLFYVLTNDRPYAESFTVLSTLRYEFVECDEVEGLAWMKRCTRGGICSNSTYAWWGAALDPSRTLVLPSRWMNTLEQPDYRIPGCIVEEVGIDAYCIHLPHRTDRLAHLIALQDKNPALQIHLVDAVHSPGAGWKGCLQSHQAVVRYAKDNRLPYILVLEDDCDLLVSPTEFQSALLAAIDYLTTTPSVQIVSGCGNLITWSASVVGSRGGLRFLTSPDIRTAHCIFYSASAYDTLLAFQETDAFDVQMNQCSIVFTYPYLATQLPGYSDNESTMTEYTNIDRSRAFVQNLLEPPRLQQEVQQPVNLRPVFRIPIRTKRV